MDFFISAGDQTSDRTIIALLFTIVISYDAAGLFDDFEPLAGDRVFGEDGAVMIGLGRFRGKPVAVVGQERAG